MSRCISSHGEYGSHEPGTGRCEWCRVWTCPSCDDDLPYPLDADDHACAKCPKCGVTVTDQTPSWFYLEHDERCGGPLDEPTSPDSAPGGDS